jgi:hypothetical protein
MVSSLAVPARASAAQGGRPATGARAWALFLTFLGFYLLTASGHLYTVDEETLYRITESVADRRTLALPDDAWGVVLSEQRAGAGRRYAQYEPGQAFAALPFYAAGRALAIVFPADKGAYIVRFIIALFNAIVTAATVALLYRLVGALGYGERAALGLALLYGLATYAWPYARTFFAEPLATLCLLAAFYGVRVGTARLAAAEDPVADRALALTRAVAVPLLLSGPARRGCRCWSSRTPRWSCPASGCICSGASSAGPGGRGDCGARWRWRRCGVAASSSRSCRCCSSTPRSTAGRSPPATVPVA